MKIDGTIKMTQKEYLQYLEKMSIINLDPRDIEASVSENMLKWTRFYSKIGCEQQIEKLKNQNNMDFLIA